MQKKKVRLSWRACMSVQVRSSIHSLFAGPRRPYLVQYGPPWARMYRLGPRNSGMRKQYANYHLSYNTTFIWAWNLSHFQVKSRPILSHMRPDPTRHGTCGKWWAMVLYGFVRICGSTRANKKEWFRNEAHKYAGSIRDGINWKQYEGEARALYHLHSNVIMCKLHSLVFSGA